MNEDPPPKDLVILAADKNIEYGLRGLLERKESLGIRAIEYDLYVHSQKDPGCLRRAHDFLRPFHRKYERALVVFDREGSGKEDTSREELQREVSGRLKKNGWGERAATVVLDPELEIWAWSESQAVDKVIGWAGLAPTLRERLVSEGFLQQGAVKPIRPKESLEWALEVSKKARSSSLYRQLAGVIPLASCTDASFQLLRSTLQAWFPPLGAAKRHRK